MTNWKPLVERFFYALKLTALYGVTIFVFKVLTHGKTMRLL